MHSYSNTAVCLQYGLVHAWCGQDDYRNSVRSMGLALLNVLLAPVQSCPSTKFQDSVSGRAWHGGATREELVIGLIYERLPLIRSPHSTTVGIEVAIAIFTRAPSSAKATQVRDMSTQFVHRDPWPPARQMITMDADVGRRRYSKGSNGVSEVDAFVACVETPWRAEML
jgi:hypothetical protein